MYKAVGCGEKDIWTKECGEIVDQIFATRQLIVSGP